MLSAFTHVVTLYSPEEVSAHTDHGILCLLEAYVTLEPLIILVFMVLVSS